MVTNPSDGPDLHMACKAQSSAQSKSLVRRFLAAITSDLVVGMAAYGWAASGCCPFDAAPTKWGNADLDALLSIQDDPKEHESKSADP